ETRLSNFRARKPWRSPTHFPLGFAETNIQSKQSLESFYPSPYRPPAKLRQIVHIDPAANEFQMLDTNACSHRSIRKYHALRIRQYFSHPMNSVIFYEFLGSPLPTAWMPRNVRPPA